MDSSAAHGEAVDCPYYAEASADQEAIVPYYHSAAADVAEDAVMDLAYRSKKAEGSVESEEMDVADLGWEKRLVWDRFSNRVADEGRA